MLYFEAMPVKVVGTLVSCVRNGFEEVQCCSYGPARKGCCQVGLAAFSFKF